MTPANALSLIGRWNIVEMELWDAEAFNMVTQAHIEFVSRATWIVSTVTKADGLVSNGHGMALMRWIL